MLSPISPKKSQHIRRFISLLYLAAEKLPQAKRSELVTRYDHIYGDLTGQRALSAKDVSGCAEINQLPTEISTNSFVLAVETYFATICNLISAAALVDDPVGYLKSIAELKSPQFDDRIYSLVSCSEHVQKGLKCFKDSFELDWYASNLDASLKESLRHTVLAVSTLWQINGPLLSLQDPLQIIHDETFPRNLVHVTGQFYTPPWMCEMLVNDITVRPDALIIDPFCGSGAFLINGLKALIESGVPIEQALEQVLGIDLNPSACIAARTNIILFAKKSGVKCFENICINIICADSLAPAVSQGEKTHSDLLSRSVPKIILDGEIIDIDPNSQEAVQNTIQLLQHYGINTKKWIANAPIKEVSTHSLPMGRAERKLAEQLFVYMVKAADVMLTNPPWVGWEYISRPYRDYLNPAWGVYNLFEQKGLQAAFLKEDLSTLCIATSCDRYLKAGGDSQLVIRPAAMQSDLSARGLRRLSLFVDSGYLNLQKIRIFEGLQVFGNAAAPAATWQLKKHGKTSFPVAVERWVKDTQGWQPSAKTSLIEVKKNTTVEPALCSPSDPNNTSSRWAICNPEIDVLKSKLFGSNNLQPRIGFFTGGANAVYYMRVIDKVSHDRWLCENITERAKRAAEKVSCYLESDLIYSVIRGRDIGFWVSNPEVHVLCPHNKQTKMYPYEEEDMNKAYPLSYSYLNRMKPILIERKGFAGWEKKIHEDYFYSLQRIGDYTFAPFKVCWSYISEDFVISVIKPGDHGKPIFPNDKVVFISYDSEHEAYFTAGILSSSPVRLSVISSASARQISANVIKHIKLPNYDESAPTHRKIAETCKKGHLAMAEGNLALASDCYKNLNSYVAKLFGFSADNLKDFQNALRQRLGFYPFHPRNSTSKIDIS